MAQALEPLLGGVGLADPQYFKRLSRSGRALVNGQPAGRNATIAAGDLLTLAGQSYTAVETGIRKRLNFVPELVAPTPKKGTVRVHCGFHKCLTMYSRGIYGAATRFDLLRPRGFQHFYHRIEAFYAGCEDFRITSVSGHVIDLDRFENIRVVRVVRDPRDLMVSSYFYHKRGAEGWCLLEDPVDADWAIVNGKVPSALPPGATMTTYLNNASTEDGLAAEFEFRRYHLDAMRDWPADGHRIRTYRYEDIMGREGETYAEILAFMGLSPVAQRIGARHAERHSTARARARNTHVRNPVSGQWRELMPAGLADRIAAEYGDVLERYGYSRR